VKISSVRIGRRAAILAFISAFQLIGLSATLNFGSDLVNESNQNRTTAGGALAVLGTNILITPHPVWEMNHADAKWVSFALTGDSQTQIPIDDMVDPDYDLSATANFHELFNLSGIVNSAFVRVWADDTSAVYLNGSLIQAPNAVQDNACAAGSISCEPHEGLLIDLKATGKLRSGSNVLTFSVFQRGNGPFGILYEGSADTTATPEPASIALLGGGLMSLVYYARRRKQNARQ
jgi:hypothetical protein